MTKKLLASGLMLMGLLAAGCEDPIAAKQDEMPPLQVSMTDDWLRNTVLVRTPVPERVGAGQLKVTVQVYNRTGDPINLDYKYFFTDKDGTAIDDGPVTGWHLITGGVSPHGWTSFTFTSLSAGPADFRVQLRKAQ